MARRDLRVRPRGRRVLRLTYWGGGRPLRRWARRRPPGRTPGVVVGAWLTLSGGPGAINDAGCAQRPQGKGVRLGAQWAVKPRSRRLLLTTKTEENAIAAPAIIGLSIAAIASGIAATL